MKFISAIFRISGWNNDLVGRHLAKWNRPKKTVKPQNIRKLLARGIVPFLPLRGRGRAQE
jgi:hypothetical protein